jgi:multicomponent Na+:H+ antiporter subunit B
VTSLVLVTTSRILLPLMALVSVFMLLRGHNEPGGGFIGGMLMAIALALHVLTQGARSLPDVLRIRPRTLVGLGLLLAALSGCIAFLAGQPFLAGQWLAVPIPGIGKAGSVLLFDIGVYLVVLGATMMILVALSEEEPEW